MRNTFLVLAAFAALSCRPAFGEDAEGSFERTLTVTGPVDLDVQTGSGHIEVRAGGASAVVIRANIRVREGFFGSQSAAQRVRDIESHPPIQQNGNVIRVGHMEDPEARRHVSIAYELTVPSETRLRSNTGSGHITVEGVRGPVNAETGSGGVTVSKIRDEVRARTGSGRMELADTGSGGVHVEQTGSGDIRAHTGSGGVTVHTPAKAGFDLRAHTGFGSITVDRPMTVQGTISKHELMAKVAGGGTAIVDVRTGSGSIRIQ